uniref:Uncharacterized protein n=1 Tax=Heterorhabditis bacteriophora TaxID=37862 RepID=A0A1I7WM59_HETBA
MHLIDAAQERVSLAHKEPENQVARLTMIYENTNKSEMKEMEDNNTVPNKNKNGYSAETERNIERGIPRDNSVEDISDITRYRSSNNHALHKDSATKPVRTPHLSIPKFNGSVKDLEEFWGMFETLVHYNRELSNMEKIMYLQDSLASELSPKITSRWYPQNRLAIISRPFDLPPAGSSPEECDETLDSIKTLVNQMTCQASMLLQNTTLCGWM